MSPERIKRTAIVLSGGGTRGAYEVGVIHYLRTMLPPDLRKGLKFHILCGSSVGAINSTFLAATADDPEYQGKELVKLWQEIRNDNIYKTGAFSLGRFLLRSFLGICSHIIGIKGVTEPDDRSLHFQGFFDTTPFMQFLLKRFPWPGISKNIEAGLVDAVAVSATNLLTGDLEIFLQKNLITPHSDRMVVREVKISPRHVLASAALPFIFPPVPIHGLYYNDGGIRLNTPLAPAVS